MDTNILIDCVRSGLNDVISSHFTSPPKIQICQGSDTGDGYSSKTHSINLKGHNENIDIFVKYLPNNDYSKELLDISNRMYCNEHRFYREIFPAMLQFQKERSIETPFINVPNYFRTKFRPGEVPPVFLENIKLKGYELRDRKKPIDEQHITLVVTTHAKYHAVSFAMKDQTPDLFEKLSSGLGDTYSETFKDFGMADVVLRGVNELKESTDPVADKKIYDCLHNLANNLIEHCSTLDKQVDKYAVICQGDSWSNNMMFLYDHTTSNPVDIKLLDWQITRLNSPILDVAYFFYTAANKEALENFDNYMNVYYDALSNQIKVLGSDPEKLYPEEIFKQHWKKLCKFGLAMSFFIVKALLFDKDEVPNTLDADDANVDLTLFCAKIKNQDIYIQKMKDLLDHFIDRDFL